MKQVIAAAGILAVLGTGAGDLRAAPAGTKPKPAPGRAAAAKPWAAALSRLQKDEAAVKSGRLTLVATNRAGELPKTAKPAEARDAALKAPLRSQNREHILFSGSDWRREITTLDPQGLVTGRLVVGFREKNGRVLQENGHGETAARNGTIGVNPGLGLADAVLMSRSAPLLSRIEWSAATTRGTQIVLTGTEGSAKLSVTLRTVPRYAIERVAVTHQGVTPSGSVTQGQEIAAAYEIEKGTLLLKSMEQLGYATGAVNQAAITSYKVEGAQVNHPVRADELEVVFPAGTRVTDRRVEPPARYVAGEKELTLAEVKALAEQAAATSAKVGKPAPEWNLKTLDGKSPRLGDYRGKVILLTWFASWCGPCKAEAPRMEKNIWLKFRDQGLAVFGVNAGEREDPEKKARAFVSEHGVTYPTLMDIENTASEAYNIEAYPTIALIDRKGVLRYIQAGFDEEGVLKQLQALLAEKE